MNVPLNQPVKITEYKNGDTRRMRKNTGLNLAKKKNGTERREEQRERERERKENEVKKVSRLVYIFCFSEDRVKTGDTFAIHRPSQTRNRTKLVVSRAGRGTRQLLDLRVLKNCV